MSIFASGRRMISGVRLSENLTVEQYRLFPNLDILYVPALNNIKKPWCLCTSVIIMPSGSSMEMSSTDNQSTRLHNESSATLSLSGLPSVVSIQANLQQRVVEHQARELVCLTPLPRGFTRCLRESWQQRGFQFEGRYWGSQTSLVPRLLWAHPFHVCPSPDGCHAVLLPWTGICSSGLRSLDSLLPWRCPLGVCHPSR